MNIIRTRLKTTIVLSGFFLFNGGLFAQDLEEEQVPQMVKAKLNKMFPGAEEVDWTKEGNNYEADFEKNDRDIQVLMDEKGTVIETEYEINLSELPKALNEYVSQKFQGAVIKSASKVIDGKGGITFLAEVGEEELIFDSKGVFKGKKSNQ